MTLEAQLSQALDLSAVTGTLLGDLAEVRDGLSATAAPASGEDLTRAGRIAGTIDAGRVGSSATAAAVAGSSGGGLASSSVPRSRQRSSDGSDETVEGYVQLGALSGQPTSFAILGPWDLEQQESSSGGIGGWILGLIAAGIITTALVLGQRVIALPRFAQLPF